MGCVCACVCPSAGYGRQYRVINRHYITEILLKIMLNQTKKHTNVYLNTVL